MTVVREERVDEPLEEVVIRYRNDRVEVISLCWNRRSFKVTENHSHWVDRSFQPPVHGFTVTVDSGDILELAFQEGQATWRLERVFLE